MQSCRFFCCFFSRAFNENFKFLKNSLYDFHKILHSHSTPKSAPACARASKSYDWNVRNIAKISPEMAKKQPLFASHSSESEGKRHKPTLLPHMWLWFVILICGYRKTCRLHGRGKVGSIFGV